MPKARRFLRRLSGPSVTHRERDLFVLLPLWVKEAVTLAQSRVWTAEACWNTSGFVPSPVIHQRR